MSVYVGLKKGDIVAKMFVTDYHCGGCGYPVTDHDSYCPECGGAFQESFATERTGHIVMGPSVISNFGDWVTCDMTRHCSECGSEINEPADVLYCWHCGAKVVG